MYTFVYTYICCSVLQCIFISIPAAGELKAHYLILQLTTAHCKVHT